MGRMTIALLCVLLLASGCGESAGESPGEVAATSSTQPSTTTTEATTTSQATTTTEVATTTTAPSTDPEPVAMLVTWDGDDCVYEGPETIGNFDVVEFTHRNDSDDVSIVGVGSLATSGPTYEDIAAEMAKGGKITDEPVLGLAPRVSVPELPELLAAGDQATMDVNFSVAREHIVVCFGGDLSGPQNVVPAGSFRVSR